MSTVNGPLDAIYLVHDVPSTVSQVRRYSVAETATGSKARRYGIPVACNSF